MARRTRGIGLVVWLVAGVLLTAPMWTALGARGLALGLLGPLGMLLFKPGEQLSSKLVLVLLLSSPTIAGLSVVMWKWSSLGVKGRYLCIVGLSLVWHAIGAGLWLFLLSGFN